MSETALGELDDWDELAAALNAAGIRHIAPGASAAAVPTQRLPAGSTLIARLLSADDVRLQEASVLLLLTRPNLADTFAAEAEHLPGETGVQAKHRYVAAAALQRMWRSRIAWALGPQALIPARYLDQLGLPDLDQDFGRATLRSLCELAEARWGYDAWAGYTSLLALFLNEIEHPAWGKPRARTR